MSDTSPDTSNAALIPLIEAAAEAAVQRSLYQTVVPIFRHGTVREMNPYQWIHKVQMDGDTDTIEVVDVTVTGVFTNARVTVMFAPPHQAMIIGVVRPGWLPYPVEWTCPLGVAPAVGNGTLLGAYRRTGQNCEIKVVLLFGSTTGGGSEGWRFSLPFVAANDVSEQIVQVKAFTNGLNPLWDGWAYIPSSVQYMDPFLPEHALTSGLAWCRNTDATLAVGTGHPQVAGQHTWTDGKSMTINGFYKPVP